MRYFEKSELNILMKKRKGGAIFFAEKRYYLFILFEHVIISVPFLILSIYFVVNLIRRKTHGSHTS